MSAKSKTQKNETVTTKKVDVKPLEFKTFPVKGFRHITNGVKKPLVVLEVDGYKRGVARDLSQFLIDLKNSGIVMNPNATTSSPEFLRVLAKFKQGRYRNWTFTGEVRYNNVGDTIILTPESSEVRNNGAVAGEPHQIKSEGFWVEGFLTFEPNARELNRMEERDAYIDRRLEMELADLFSEPATDTMEVDNANVAEEVAEEDEAGAAI